MAADFTIGTNAPGPGVRPLGHLALALMLLATSCSGTATVWLDDPELAESASTPIGTAEPEPSQSSSAVEQAEPVPEPTPPEPSPAEPTPEPPVPEPTGPVPEPTAVLADGGLSVFDSPTGRAPVFATGTGGGCLDADGVWANGFQLGVFLRDTAGLVSVTTEAVSAPIVLAISTLPRELAWTTLEAELSTSDALSSLSIDDVQSGFALDILSFDGPHEDQLAALVENLRTNRSVLAITNSRCTNNAVAQLLDGDG